MLVVLTPLLTSLSWATHNAFKSSTLLLADSTTSTVNGLPSSSRLAFSSSNMPSVNTSCTAFDTFVIWPFNEFILSFTFNLNHDIITPMQSINNLAYQLYWIVLNNVVFDRWKSKWLSLMMHNCFSQFKYNFFFGDLFNKHKIRRIVYCKSCVGNQLINSLGQFICGTSNEIQRMTDDVYLKFLLYFFFALLLLFVYDGFRAGDDWKTKLLMIEVVPIQMNCIIYVRTNAISFSSVIRKLQIDIILRSEPTDINNYSLYLILLLFIKVFPSIQYQWLYIVRTKLNDHKVNIFFVPTMACISNFPQHRIVTKMTIEMSNSTVAEL